MCGSFAKLIRNHSRMEHSSCLSNGNNGEDLFFAGLNHSYLYYDRGSDLKWAPHLDELQRKSTMHAHGSLHTDVSHRLHGERHAEKGKKGDMPAKG